ncbi:MAG: CvpA family protein [Clostridiales bacterium]|nr:CvpA family protein [Clostridiales bacterium]
MSVADYVIIGIIVIFALVGLKSGLLKTIYKMVSYVASFYLAIKLSRPVAGWFEGTGVYNGIKEAVEKLISNLNINFSGVTDVTNAEEIKEAIAQTPFPDNFKELIANALAKASNSTMNMMDNFVESITSFILIILCGIILFIILRILFWLAGHLIKGISEIPIIKQVDRISGFILGAAIGIAVVYLLGLLLTYTATWEKLGFVYKNIEEGTIAPFFYNDNILTQFFNLGKDGLT